MFAKERDWALSYGSQIKDASEKFSAVANARLRLIQQLGHLAGALSITVAGIIIIIVTINIIIINTIIISKQSSTLPKSTTMQWSESLSTFFFITKQGFSFIIFPCFIRKRGGQWRLQQTHKWIFWLHRNNKGEENQPCLELLKIQNLLGMEHSPKIFPQSCCELFSNASRLIYWTFFKYWID